MKIIILVILSFSLFSCSLKPKEKPIEEKTEAKITTPKPNWGYTGLIGPQMWGSLKDEYKLCKEGKTQSPINLIWQKPKPGGMLKFNYTNSPFSIENLGHNIKLTMHSDENFVRVRGKKYQLKFIEFHFPSEHQLSGKTFSGEIHLAHQDANGDWAFVSSLVSIGDHLQDFDILLSHIPSEKMVPIKVYSAYFNPESLLPSRKTYYNYNGSLTIPPCSENVDWNILNTDIEISKPQFDKISTYIKGNNRPLQAPNNRNVVNYR